MMDFELQAKNLLHELFPICRSLTGNGNRKTLGILKEFVPLEVFEIPSGKQVYDWVIPDEWNISEAYLATESGERVLDFKINNLHVASYSVPVDLVLDFEELRPHLYTLAEAPDAIPYRTLYYKRDWGFCLSQNHLNKLDQKKKYRAVIKSDLNPKGSLTLAHSVHKGRFDREILLSSYFCHPSMANDNLSGVILSTLLFSWIKKQKTNYSYRLILVPETLGAIAYLHENEVEIKKRVVGGAVFSTCGGPGALGLKPTFIENHWMDEIARDSLSKSGRAWTKFPFVPDGSDERQYASPGFRIPTLSITKDKYYTYKEYHTSLDNLDFVKPEQLRETFDVCVSWIKSIDNNLVFERKEKHCEFQLGKRGLYPETGGAFRQDSDRAEVLNVDALSWLMFGCDGKTDLWKLSVRSGIPLEVLAQNAVAMEEKGLLVARCL